MNGDEKGSSEGDAKGRGEGNSDQARPVRSSRYSRALERGLAIVACFTVERPLLGIRELAEMLDMSPATTYRYVSALATQGYLEQDPATSKYRLDLGAIDLGMAALSATGLCMHARPYLESLAERTSYTVALAVLDGPEILPVSQVPGSRRGQSRAGTEEVRVGSRLPAYCTSLGKVLLAEAPADWQAELISEMELLERAPKTILTAEQLQAELDRVRDDGFAVNDEELAAGTCAIAAPVRDESGDVIAAVSVAALGGEIELEQLTDRCLGPLMATAERISARLGWQEEGQ